MGDELVEKVRAIADNLANDDKTARHEAFRSLKAFTQSHGAETWNRMLLNYMKKARHQ